MTDGHFSYRLAQDFQHALGQLEARHKLTRRYRPQTNGKAERFIQTLSSGSGPTPGCTGRTRSGRQRSRNGSTTTITTARTLSWVPGCRPR